MSIFTKTRQMAAISSALVASVSCYTTSAYADTCQGGGVHFETSNIVSVDSAPSTFVDPRDGTTSINCNGHDLTGVDQFIVSFLDLNSGTPDVERCLDLLETAALKADSATPTHVDIFFSAAGPNDRVDFISSLGTVSMRFVKGADSPSRISCVLSKDLQ